MSSASPIDVLTCGMAVDRFAVYLSSEVIFGVGVFTLLLARERVALATWPRLRLHLDVAVSAFTLGTLLWLPLEAGQASGTWTGVFHGDTLQTLLWDTHSGSLWIGRSVVCLLLVAVHLASPDRIGRMIGFLLSGASLALLAFAGHGAMDDSWLGSCHEFNDIIHVIASSGWLGGLIALWACLNQLEDPDLRRPACEALALFSMLGHIAVALVVLTGIANTYLVLGAWPINTGSLYQMLLLTKILLVAGMIAIAHFNRYVLVPRFRRRDSGVAFAIMQLKRLTIIELGMGTFVLTLVSVFGMLDPT